MANEGHLQILKRGIPEWNEWRYAFPEVIPDLRAANLSYSTLYKANLREADLRGANLRETSLIFAEISGANLSCTDLSYANLSGMNFHDMDLSQANLFGVNFCKANLRCTNFEGANLSHADCLAADLSGANLFAADLSSTDFRYANLSFADLRHTTLHGTDFIDADLRGATINKAKASSTVFANVDLREVKGLWSMNHTGPSEVSVSAISRSEGRISKVFLRNCGLKDWEIEAAKLYRIDLSKDQVIELTYEVIELRTDPLLQFNSCFISYSSKDEEFARRLYTDLQNSGGRCWFAPEDMKIGDRIRHCLDDSIRLHDKLLLVLSKNSVASQWIEQEVATALEKEREQGCDVLFPIRLDDTVLNLRSDWPSLIKNTRHIGDFSRWAKPDDYKRAFKHLLNDLRMDA